MLWGSGIRNVRFGLTGAALGTRKLILDREWRGVRYYLCVPESLHEFKSRIASHMPRSKRDWYLLTSSNATSTASSISTSLVLVCTASTPSGFGTRIYLSFEYITITFSQSKIVNTSLLGYAERI